MKKKALMILMIAVLAFSGVLSPAMAAAAEENTQEAEETQEEADTAEEKSLLEQGSKIGEDLYKKMDEAIDGVDKGSLRKSIREALEEMDELGISPSTVARNLFGIRTTYKKNEKAPENTLIRDAQNAVQKKTEGFFTVLWNGFLDTIEKMITTGISVFGSEDANVAKGGSGK